MTTEDKNILVKFLLDRIIEADPLEKYIYHRSGNTTIYHIPNNIFMNFDLTEIKKHYSHFSWQLDSRWTYCEVTTELRQRNLLP